MLEDACISALEANARGETEGAMKFLALVSGEFSGEHGDERVECVVTVSRAFCDNRDEHVGTFVADGCSMSVRFGLGGHFRRIYQRPVCHTRVCYAREINNGRDLRQEDNVVGAGVLDARGEHAGFVLSNHKSNHKSNHTSQITSQITTGPGKVGLHRQGYEWVCCGSDRNMEGNRGKLMC